MVKNHRVLNPWYRRVQIFDVAQVKANNKGTYKTQQQKKKKKNKSQRVFDFFLKDKNITDLWYKVTK